MDSFVIMKEWHVGGWNQIVAGPNHTGNNFKVYNSRSETKKDIIELSLGNSLVPYCIIERNKVFPDCLRDVYINGKKVEFVIDRNTKRWYIKRR